MHKKTHTSAVVGAVFTMGLMQTGTLTLLPVLMSISQLSETHWAWLISSAMFGVVVLGPLWGRWVDQYGAHKTLQVSFLGFTVSNVLLLVALGLPHGIWLIAGLVVSRVFYSLFVAGIYPSAQALVTETESSSESVDNLQVMDRLAKLNGLNQIGRLLGPVLVGVCVWSSWALMPLAALVLISMLAAAALLISFRQLTLRANKNITNARDDKGALLERDDGTVHERHSRHIQKGWPLYALAYSLTLFVGVLQFVIGPALMKYFNLLPETATFHLGGMLTVAALAALTTSLLGTRWLSKHAKTFAALPIIVMLVLLSVGSVLLAVGQGLLFLYTGVIFLSMGMALCTPWYGSELRRQSPTLSGRIGGNLSSLHMLGYGSGTLIGGYGLALFENNVFFVFILMPVVATLFACLAYRRTLRSPH